MIRLFASRLLLLLIALVTAALLASYVGVEKEERWRMEGTVYQVAAFPAADAWPFITATLNTPDTGAAVTSASPNVASLVGQPAHRVFGAQDSAIGVVPSTSAFAARAAAGDLTWPGVEKIIVRDLSGAPDQAAAADLLIGQLSPDSTSLVGVLGGPGETIEPLIARMRDSGITVDATPLPPTWEAAARRTIHLPALALLGGFALVGAHIVWHSTLRSVFTTAVIARRLVGASPLRAALAGARTAVGAWVLAAAVSVGFWALLWPRWDPEIGLTADTFGLWAGLLTLDGLLVAGTLVSALWMRQVRS